MTLRRITNGNSVKCMPSVNSSSSESSHDPKSKTVPNPRKQNKKFSQTNENLIEEIVTGEGFRILEWIMICCF